MACKRSRVRLPYPPLPLEMSRWERSQLLRLIKEQWQRVAELRRGGAETADFLILHHSGVWFKKHPACQTKLREVSRTTHPHLTFFPNNMKLFSVFLAALVLAFLLLMHNIQGLRTEKVLKEGATWQEVHIVWDWNKMTDWSKGQRFVQKIEQKQKEKTDTDTENKKK